MNIVELKDHIKQVRGVSFSAGISIKNELEGYLPVLRSNNIKGASINFEDLMYVPQSLIKSNQLLRKGDILITASTGSLKVLGKNGFVTKNENAAFGAFCKVVRPKDSVAPNYLKHFFQSNYYFTTIRNITNGANINNIKNEHLDNLKMPLPPLAVQERIAAILDAADALRQKDQALLKKYDNLTQSLFLDMFGDTWVNPKNYPLFKLSEIVNQGKIITYGIVQAGEPQTVGIPYIRTGDIKRGSILKDQLLKTTSEIAKSYDRSKCAGGDLIMSIRATVGTIAILPQELNGCNLTQGTARISTDTSKVSRQYLFNCIASKGIQLKMDLQTKGATFREITLSRLRNIEVPIPSLLLQKEFEETVMVIEKQKEQVQSNIKKSEALFQSLLQKAFKGELVSEEMLTQDSR